MRPIVSRFCSSVCRPRTLRLLTLTFCPQPSVLPSSAQDLHQLPLLLLPYPVWRLFVTKKPCSSQLKTLPKFRVLPLRCAAFRPPHLVFAKNLAYRRIQAGEEDIQESPRRAFGEDKLTCVCTFVCPVFSGTGDSGKSTFLKQMKIINKNGFTKSEIDRYGTGGQ